MLSIYADAHEFFNRCRDAPELIQLYFEGLVSRDVETQRRCARYVRAVSSLQEQINDSISVRLKSCENEIAKTFVEAAIACTSIHAEIEGLGKCELTRLDGIVVRVDVQNETRTTTFRFKQHYWAGLVLPAFEYVRFFERATQHGFQSAVELQVVFEQDKKAFETLIRVK